ncbi:uncharacterized protein V1518DRAFT_418074 [Limtongia smithiae]|uniref:uncharacterized protein n=1 Tax=Limtongia smithiae TaxID=1125753 RepID=UPI0034CE7971
MPFDIAKAVLTDGVDALRFWPYIRRYGPWIVFIVLLRRYCAGSRNTWARDMHGRVVIMTGGTSGVGAAAAEDLARRGAQIVFLVRSTKDAWMYEFIADLRAKTGNQLLYAEEADLTSLRSIRVFATRWLDNTPVRRLDMVICCAAVARPPFTARRLTSEGVEENWGVNYLAHAHLLRLLAPALRAQPPDRDVRVLIATCSTYVLADLDLADLGFANRAYPSSRPWRAFGASKLALMLFAKQLQSTLFDNYARADKEPNNVRVFLIDPGFVRTPSMRVMLSFGRLTGLLLYLIMWPLWLIVLKTPLEGAQTLLHVAMSPDCAHGAGGKFFRECSEVTKASPRKELANADLQQRLWDITTAEIDELEKKDAIARKKAEAAAAASGTAMAAAARGSTAAPTSAGAKKKNRKTTKT